MTNHKKADVEIAQHAYKHARQKLWKHPICLMQTNVLATLPSKTKKIYPNGHKKKWEIVSTDVTDAKKPVPGTDSVFLRK